MGRPAKYPVEFRREALALVKSSGRPIAEVARSLSIAEGTLWNWVRADRELHERDADPDALSESELAELRGSARRTCSSRPTWRSCGRLQRFSRGRRTGTGFRFVDEHQAEYRVTDLCRVAGVARSSFYSWRTRTPSLRQRANTELLVEIREIHEQSRRTYGSPRITGQLRRRGHRVGHNRVARLMADNHLVGAHARRKFRRGRHPKIVPAPDLLQRDFTAEHPDQRWVADISEFRCWDGKLYLAGIRDLHDHTLVGWSMGERQTSDLVIAALVMALGRRNPGRDRVHTPTTDPSQYTSLEFTNRLHDWGLVASYGSVGDCFDNSAIEGYWATMKTEIRHIWGPFHERTRSEMRTILFDYIETFYNRTRHQAALEHRTPSEVYAAALTA